MSDYSGLADPVQAALDRLESELFAHRRDTAGGQDTSLRRRLALEGLENAFKFVLHQLEQLAVCDLESEGIDLSDPVYWVADPYSAEHLDRASGVHPVD